ILTPRERQILKLITEGSCNRIIATQLSISQKTVETHRLNMMKKLDVHKVAELIHWSYRLGLNE
ncbi:TPA: LuxR C-terminal-related transcriptional regulator, partial [Yersinia enterocolitica]